MRSLFTYSLALISLSACSLTHESGDQVADSVSDHPPRSVIINAEDLKGDVALSEDAELTFAKDFRETLSREIYPGDILNIRYDLNRITECPSTGRSYLQYITGYYQADDQPAKTFDYVPTYTTRDRLQEANIRVPEGKQLSVWFYSVDTNECESWDSNYGQNFIIPISERALPESGEESLISFLADGAVLQDQQLKSGSLMTVRYDLERLKECESYQNQRPQWGITGHMKTDLSEESLFNVTESSEGDLVALDVSLEVPPGDTLYLWFTATNRYGCYQEDQGASFDLNGTPATEESSSF